MNAELTYTLELARVFKSCVERSSALQERVGADLAFDRSLKRGHEAIIAMLYKACEELAPISAHTLPKGGGEIAEFIRALEYGEIVQPRMDTNGRESGPENLSGGVESRHADLPCKHGELAKGGLMASAHSLVQTNNASGSSAPPAQNNLRKSVEENGARGEIPGGKNPARVSHKENGTTDGTDNTDKRKLIRDSSDSSVVNSDSPSLPSDRKSREVMSQWRV